MHHEHPAIDHGHGAEHHEHHVVDYATYLKIWLGLMFLTCLTVTAATINAGAFNIVIALAIATLKAGLVIAVFMHVKFDSVVVKAFLGVAGATLFSIAVLTILDTALRFEMFH